MEPSFDLVRELAPLMVLLALLLGALTVRPRRFYFVRHGQTVLNAEHIRQGPDGSLSDLGRAQAERAGAYLSRFRITRIIASPFERTKETALIIAERIHAPIRYSELLVERKNPSEIVGKHADDPDVIRIVDQMDRAYHEDDFRISDEENFVDLRNRAQKALTLLSRQGVPETCVVTHSIFLKMLIAYMLYRDRLHAADYVKLSFFNASDNASVTICEYNPWLFWNATRGWRVITYNETP